MFFLIVWCGVFSFRIRAHWCPQQLPGPFSRAAPQPEQGLRVSALLQNPVLLLKLHTAPVGSVLSFLNIPLNWSSVVQHVNCSPWIIIIIIINLLVPFSCRITYSYSSQRYSLSINYMTWYLPRQTPKYLPSSCCSQQALFIGTKELNCLSQKWPSSTGTEAESRVAAMDGKPLNLLWQRATRAVWGTSSHARKWERFLFSFLWI